MDPDLRDLDDDNDRRLDDTDNCPTAFTRGN